MAPRRVRKPVPRDQKKEETRRALIAAAMAAFAEEGLDVPSLDAICERAGYTRGAFYVHFRDRDDLVAAVVERSTSMLLDALVATEDASMDLERTIDFFITAVEAGVYPIPGSVQAYQVLHACARSERIRERYVSALSEASRRVSNAARQGQVAGTVRADVDADQIGVVFVALVMSVQTMVEVKFPLRVRLAAEAVKKMVLTRASS